MVALSGDDTPYALDPTGPRLHYMGSIHLDLISPEIDICRSIYVSAIVCTNARM